MSTMPLPEDSAPPVLGRLRAASVLIQLTSALILIVVAGHEASRLVFSDGPSPSLVGSAWFYASLLAMVAASLLNLILARWRARISRGQLERAEKRLERIQASLGEPERADEISEEDEGGSDTEKLIKLMRSGHVAQVRALCEALSLPLDLRGADLRGADLSGADLSGIDLSGADLSGADLSRATLREAQLSGASLTSANLSGVNLSGAILRGFYLARINLRNADLSGADLSEAVLGGALLRGACLREANLSGTILHSAILAGADLSDADLSDADLRGTLFSEPPARDANLRGAILSEAHYDSKTAWPEGFAYGTSGALTTWAKTPSAFGTAIERGVCRTDDNKRFFVVPIWAQILDGPQRVLYALKSGEDGFLYVRLSDLAPYEVSKREATRHARRNAWRIAKVSVWAFFASVSRGPSKKGPDPSAAD